MDKLLNSSIKTVNKIYKENAIRPSDLTNAALERIKSTKHYNAYVAVTTEKAFAEAKNSDERLKINKRLGPLDGIPIALKDNFCTEGIKTTCASKMLENFVPIYNATVYERLKNSGAILMGKTNLDEFAMGSGTVDSIYGPTKNVWGYKDAEEDNFYIAGGSSGGSAIAVATGTCFGALGSDTGGSVRNPASYCGLVGFKPTYGLVSRHGLIPLVNSMDVPAILTRNIEDCTSILNAISGPDEKDSTTIKRHLRKVSLPKEINIKDLKIGIPQEYHCEGISDEVLETWKEISILLQQNGAIVEQVSMPNTRHSIVCYSILNQCEVSSNMARYDGIEFGLRAKNCEESTEKLYAVSRSQGFSEVIRNRILAGNYFLLQRNYNKYFEKALKVRRLIANDFDEVFEKVHVLLTPTTLTTAPKYRDFTSKNNRDQCATQDFCTQPVNMAGVPALSLPIKLSPDGLPISLQLIGRNLSESVLFTVGKFIENAVQFPKPKVVMKKN